MTPDDLAASMIPVVADIACLVRDGDRKGIERRLRKLDGQQWYAFAVVAAAMIPDDEPVADLLAWLEPGSPQREEMLRKAHNKATRRQDRGLPLWGPMAALEREYQRGAIARRKAAAEASRAA